jgi:outer membrane receptor protein involved in Fe transport
MPIRLRTVSTTASLSVLASVLLAGAAMAQTTQTDQSQATTQSSTTQSTTSQSSGQSSGSTTDKGTTTVTVTAAKPTQRIDRQVYDNTKNIDSTSGTAADALNHVPSVNVDNQGNLTLRGNSNVQVYVDGKPSAMMQGDNRAAALQAMSSSDIDSVEVMNNPGAQYSSEGSGGIINLVMKKNRRPGGFGVVTMNTGNDGRYNGNFTGSYTAGKLSFSGGLNFRHDSRLVHTGGDQERLDPSGNVVSDTQSHGTTNGHGNGLMGNGSVDYAISDKDSIGAQVNYSHRNQGGNGVSQYAVYDTTGAATSLYTRHQFNDSPHEDEALDLHWDHTGNLAGETLKVDARLSRSAGHNEVDGTNTYSLTPANPLPFDTNHSTSDLKNGVFSVDYNRPVGQDLLSAGLQVTYDDNETINHSTGQSSLTSSLSSDFAYKQTITALYLTYQKALNAKWTVLGGLRMEALDLKTDLISSGTTGHIDYTKLSPSFFATYALNDKDKLRFQYSHRLQRPAPLDLNPFLTYSSPTDVSAGNPHLRPQETDSFEARYEANRTGLNYQASVYYKKTTNEITSYSFFLTPGVLETTKQNYGDGQTGGLELVASGSLTKKLRINTDANFYYQELTTPNVSGKQSGTTPSGRVMLSYTFTPKDTGQFMFFTSGKQLTGQGYRTAFAMGNLSYKHNFTPKLSLNASVNDPFRTAKTRNVTQNQFVRSESAFSLQAPTIYLGLSYMFGGPNASQQQQQQWQRGGGYRGPGGPPGGGPGGGGPGGPF